jgi:ABC-type nitrate/sulfonate/bicarbonate transport system permease component
MSNLASSEAALGSATAKTDKGLAPLIAMRVLLLLLLLAIWQGAVATGFADAAFVSSPVSVAQSLWLLFRGGEVLPHLGTTLLEIMIAFVSSVIFGIASAVVLDRNDWLNRIIAALELRRRSCSPFRSATSSCFSLPSAA